MGLFSDYERHAASASGGQRRMAVLHSFLLMVGLHLFLRKDELHLIAHEGDLLEINPGAEQRGAVGVEEVGEEVEVLTRSSL